MVRDERHGGYGDTSNIPRLAPEEVRGAAAAAALTAVQEVQRQTADLSVVRAALAEELDAQRKAAAIRSGPRRADRTRLHPADGTAERRRRMPWPPSPRMRRDAHRSRSRRRPPSSAHAPDRRHPEVDVAELGVADRLGLGDDDPDDEVGPTS